MTSLLRGVFLAPGDHPSSPELLPPPPLWLLALSLWATSWRTHCRSLYNPSEPRSPPLICPGGVATLAAKWGDDVPDEDADADADADDGEGAEAAEGEVRGAARGKLSFDWMSFRSELDSLKGFLGGGGIVSGELHLEKEEVGGVSSSEKI